MNRKVITVTGGTGYIASWIVHDLLKGGHEVHITVRDKAKVSAYQHLLDIEKDSPGALIIYEADLNRVGSFDEAVRGAEIVIHTASPFFLDDKNDPQKNLVDPAVNGTKNILESVNRSESVIRVVLTSSVAAIYGDNQDMLKGGHKVLTEEIWNSSSSLKHNAYSYSKTEAEKVAWKMEKEQTRWSLVTIHPGFVLGPSLTKRKDSTSIETLLRILRGDLKIGSPRLNFIFSDVRDIAKGHLLAAFTQEAKGRYIIASEIGDFIDIAKMIEAKYPSQYKLPRRYVPKWLVYLAAPYIGFTRDFVKKNIAYPLAFDNTKSISDLKMEYHSFEETILDHVEQLRKDELVAIK